MHNELIKIARIMHSKKCNKIMELIKENPGISIVELQIATRDNHHAAVCQLLRELKQCSMIRMERSGKHKHIFYNYNAEKPLQLMNNLAKMLVNADD